jgi:hypothetical protein
MQIVICLNRDKDNLYLINKDTKNRKYQVMTLSSVEQAYLESIKGIEKRAKRDRKKE